jgi:membrane protease YdiL (CAAX protease family)
MLVLPRPALRAGFHALAFVLIVVAPAWIRVVSARIRATPTGESRVRGYRQGILSLLSASVAAILLVRPTTFFAIQTQNRGVGWLPSRELISAGAVLLVLLTALPVLLARRRGPFRANFLHQLQRRYDILPQSPRERLWFLIAALCAGGCEEVLYRGFLLHYLHVFPITLNIAASLVISCVVYGLVSLYQGIGGILQTILLALGMALLFLSTRSLMLPIILHMLINLRVVVTLPDKIPLPDSFGRL